eukprot:gene8751-9687_t
MSLLLEVRWPVAVVTGFKCIPRLPESLSGYYPRQCACRDQTNIHRVFANCNLDDATDMASKINNFPSGKVFLQVLGCGIEDATPSLFLFTDSKRYMFNCGEGVQRMCTESKVRLGKLNNIFFTQNKWTHLGGFLGMSMTLRDIGKEVIGVHGPAGLNEVIHGARSFLHKENINFNVKEYSLKNKDLFNDDELKIQPIVINQGSENSHSRNDWTSHISSENEDTMLINDYSVKHILENQVVCYAAKLKDYPGKLLPKVAMSLGVPKGPMFRMLKDGQTVTLPCGKMISPEEVTEPPIPGPSFLIIDCPTRKYLSAITKHKAFAKYQKDGTEQAAIVIHMTQKSITCDVLYKDWMARFHDDTYHCILDKNELSKCPSVFRAQCCVQYKLNQVHPKIFPVIEKWRCSTAAKEGHEEENGSSENSSRTFMCENLMKFNLRPLSQLGPDYSEVLGDIEAELIVEEALVALREFESSQSNGKVDNESNERNKNRNVAQSSESNAIEDSTVVGKDNVCDEVGAKRRRPDNEGKERNGVVQLKVSKFDNKAGGEINDESDICNCINGNTFEDADCKYPEIVFLGTGSSIPSKYRNVSSILVHTSPNSNVLLDCGEGTYGQIVNHYGSKAAEDIIKRLHFIFVSHMHADHHLGVIRILKIHKSLFKKDSGGKYTPPLIAGPKKFSEWLQEYAEACESLYFRFADCKIFNENHGAAYVAKHLPGMSEVVFVPVDHHTEAYGIALTHEDDWKITYSGDTEPCQNLVVAGKDSTVLIHEATFEDGMEEEAKEKHHSTFGQAMDIAAQMNAKNLLLTHFSQRYAKLPVMKNQTPVGIAFDHMEIHPREVPTVCDLLPKLQLLFPDEEKLKS